MVKARMLKNGQFIMTIPKNIAEAMRITSGDEIGFFFERGEVYIRKL